jgi:hypothetical protein
MVLVKNNNNAVWDKGRNCIVYGDGETDFDILTSLDVVAHEFGHGVCFSTANLNLYGESGAINESLSDIWAACVENFAEEGKMIWIIGEDIERRPGHFGLRFMYDPKATGQPDTYGGPNYSPDSKVHVNSGIMNYWFYLLCGYSSGTGINDLGNYYNVSSIDMSKAEKIVYLAETEYMTSNTGFYQARNYTITAASLLYGANSQEVISVTNAWYAVGVGDSYSSGSSYSASASQTLFFSYYPNPGNDILTISPGKEAASLVRNAGTYTVQIISVASGITFLTEEFAILNKDVRLDISKIPEGTYKLVIFQNGKPVQSEGLIIRR